MLKEALVRTRTLQLNVATSNTRESSIKKIRFMILKLRAITSLNLSKSPSTSVHLCLWLLQTLLKQRKFSQGTSIKLLDITCR